MKLVNIMKMVAMQKKQTSQARRTVPKHKVYSTFVIFTRMVIVSFISLSNMDLFARTIQTEYSGGREWNFYVEKGGSWVGNGAAYSVGALVSDKTGDVIIPRTLGGHHVIGIGGCAFCFYFSVTSVEIPNTVRFIESQAFRDCQSISEMVIPESVESIGYGAFFRCFRMTEIQMPEVGITNIGFYAFNQCSSLSSVTIPKTVKTLGGGSFLSCGALKEVVFLGKPPRVIGERGQESSESVGSTSGFYSRKYKSEWLSVLDANSKWHGLKMSQLREYYTIVYDSNGGVGNVEHQTGEFDGDKLIASDGNNLYCEGRKFVGWALAANGEVAYKPGDYVAEPAEGDTITLYAVWAQPLLSIVPLNADWHTGSIEFRSYDEDSTGANHKYSLSYYDEEGGTWLPAEGSTSTNVNKGDEGIISLADAKFSIRNNGIGTVKYRVMDENGRCAECVTRYRHGLFVGVDEYQNAWQELDGHFDHYLLASTFAGSYTRYGGKCGYVKVLHGDETKKETLFIQLDYISKSVAAPGDIVLFYYVGHGWEHLVTCWNENDGIVYASELAERFKGFPSGTAVVAIFDTCYSDSLIDKQYDWEKDGNVGWIVASQKDQKAYCGQLKSVICDNGWLKGKADIIGSNVEADGNGYVTFAELALWGQEWMGDKKNYEGNGSLYEFGQLMSFYNSSVLCNIVAGRVPEKTTDERIWNWLSRFRNAWTKTEGDVQNAKEVLAANNLRTIDECYLLGIDPDNPNDDFLITEFKIEDGEPKITLNHYEDGDGNSFVNKIRILGKKNLGDADWVDITDEDKSQYRFFSVSVKDK